MRHGFTLLDLLITIAILAIITAIVAISINSYNRYTQAWDARRDHEVKQIQQAITQYEIDNWGPPPGIPEGEINAVPICNEGVTNNPTCLNLDVLTPTYIAELPVDPFERNFDYTGYGVYTIGDHARGHADHKEYLEGCIISGTSVGHWSFNEGPASTVLDTSGTADGIVYGSPVWSTDVPTIKNSYSLEFDTDMSDYIRIPLTNHPKPTQEMTITAWAKDQGGVIFHQSNWNNIALWTGASTVRGYLRTNNGSVNTNAVTKSSTDWYFVALSYDGSFLRIYVDGVLMDSVAITGDIQYGGSQPDSYIGIYRGAGGFCCTTNKFIDDVRFYDRVLTPEEIEGLAICPRAVN